MSNTPSPLVRTTFGVTVPFRLNLNPSRESQKDEKDRLIDQLKEKLKETESTLEVYRQNRMMEFAPVIREQELRIEELESQLSVARGVLEEKDMVIAEQQQKLQKLLKVRAEVQSILRTESFPPTTVVVPPRRNSVFTKNPQPSQTNDVESSRGRGNHIVINVQSRDQSKLTFLSRLRAGLGKEAHIEINGDSTDVVDLMNRMEEFAEEHTALAKKVPELEQLAQRQVNELDVLKKRPDCTITAHRGLIDELAAKEAQYELNLMMLRDYGHKLRALQEPKSPT